MSANKPETFSASEINKFCYCRLQWYYGRIYGAKQLNEWRRERNGEMGWDSPEGESPFERGRKFHREYTGKHNRKLALRKALLAAAVAVLLLAAFAAVTHGIN